MCFRAIIDYTLQDMRQFDKLHRRFRGKALSVVSNVLLILATLVVLAAGVLLLWIRAFDGEMLRLYLLLLVLYLLLPLARELRVRTSFKTIHSQGTIRVTADDSGLFAEAKAIQSSFAYDGICDIVHYKQCYYLYLNKRQANILPERCFTEGDPAAFGAFLAEKTGLTIQEIK